jgi:hypothetical protein
MISLLLPLLLLLGFVDASTSMGYFNCQFTIDNSIIKVYLNDVDVTSSVTGDLTNWPTANSLSLPIPTQNAVLGFIGRELDSRSSSRTSGLQLQCTGTTPNWHFFSEVNSGWTAMASPNLAENIFPVNWFTEAYNDSSWSPVVPSTSSFSLSGGSEPKKKIWVGGGSTR